MLIFDHRHPTAQVILPKIRILCHTIIIIRSAHLRYHTDQSRIHLESRPYIRGYARRIASIQQATFGTLHQINRIPNRAAQKLNLPYWQQKHIRNIIMIWASRRAGAPLVRHARRRAVRGSLNAHTCARYAGLVRRASAPPLPSLSLRDV